jgi:hypothetical protein
VQGRRKWARWGGSSQKNTTPHTNNGWQGLAALLLGGMLEEPTDPSPLHHPHIIAMAQCTCMTDSAQGSLDQPAAHVPPRNAQATSPCPTSQTGRKKCSAWGWIDRDREACGKREVRPLLARCTPGPPLPRLEAVVFNDWQQSFLLQTVGHGYGLDARLESSACRAGPGSIAIQAVHIEALARPLLLLERAEVQHVSASLCRLTEKSF